MSEIRLQRNLKIPPVPALDALRQILSAIERQESGWRGFAVHVALGDLHLPDVGYLAIPIRLTAGNPDPTTHAIDIEFTAAKHPESFPHFTGSAGIDATGPTGSTLFVDGSYDVPLAIFGRLIDMTLASGVAEKTLENFADDLAVAIHETVEKREAEYVRYRLY